jgi:carbon-monoxide dehydrogenase medium subunit
VLNIQGVNGARQEPLKSFFLGPGKTTLKPGDIVTAIRFPVPPRGCAGRYLKLGRNQLSDLSIVGVTALGYPDPACSSGFRFRLALASVAPVPFLPVEVETYLANNPITADAIQEAARLAAEACTPIDDVRSSARYRKQMVNKLSARALTSVWQKLS